MAEFGGENRAVSRLKFDSKTRFPFKLYQVANDSYLVKWSPQGTSVLVDEEVFEEEVMKCYPGFVKIASFVNFRRLFREYSFEWKVVDGTDTLFEFSHPSFVRGGLSQLGRVKTKRKCFYKHFLHRLDSEMRPLATSSPKRYYRRRRYRLRSNCESESSLDNTSADGDQIPELSAMKVSFKSVSNLPQVVPDGVAGTTDDGSNPPQVQYPQQPYLSTQVMNAMNGVVGVAFPGEGRVTPRDLNEVLAIYAKNELSEEELFELMSHRCDENLGETMQRMLNDSGETTYNSPPPTWGFNGEFLPLDYTWELGRASQWMYGESVASDSWAGTFSSATPTEFDSTDCTNTEDEHATHICECGQVLNNPLDVEVAANPLLTYSLLSPASAGFEPSKLTPL